MLINQIGTLWRIFPHSKVSPKYLMFLFYYIKTKKTRDFLLFRYWFPDFVYLSILTCKWAKLSALQGVPENRCPRKHPKFALTAKISRAFISITSVHSKRPFPEAVFSKNWLLARGFASKIMDMR